MEYRAAYWISEDRQNEMVLTTPESSLWPDKELKEEAIRWMKFIKFNPDGGKIEIGMWSDSTESATPQKNSDHLSFLVMSAKKLQHELDNLKDAAFQIFPKKIWASHEGQVRGMYIREMCMMFDEWYCVYHYPSGKQLTLDLPSAKVRTTEEYKALLQKTLEAS